MGMFDTIICQHPLPDGKIPFGIFFQSKSLPTPMMRTFKITENGRLVADVMEMQEVPKHERPYPNEPDDSLLAYTGCFREVLVKPDVDRNFDGVINFYNDNFEYQAIFERGQLKHIKPVAHTIGIPEESALAT